MHQVPPHSIWLGHVGDARDLGAVHGAGILVLVDLAAEEPPQTVPRDLVYCRFPLIDGADNPPWLLSAAVEAVTRFIRTGIPTLVFCGAGMSRSPGVVAAALSRVIGVAPNETLATITRLGAADVSPLLWLELRTVVG